MIVDKIETAFAWLDVLSAEREKAEQLLEHLNLAVLNKAFRGELIPQDSSDEPAEKMLARIRAARQAEAPKRRRGWRKVTAGTTSRAEG